MNPIPTICVNPANTLLRYFLIASSLSMPAMAQDIIPPPKPAADESAFGKKIARTMTDLATSTPQKRNPVRVLFYGQSITAQPWSAAITQRLKTTYPDADLTIENRAIGGFEADRLMKTARQDLYPFYPDLVIFQVYGGGNGELESILSDIRRQTTAEVMISTHHVSHEGNAWVQSEYDKQSQAIRDLAKKYDCELVDVRDEWKQYLAENQLKTQDLLRDSVHLNDKGNQLMADLVWRHLRYDKDFANPHADEIQTVPVKPAADGSYRIPFTGNRVDIVANPADDPRGTARILIDGQPPSANPKAYTVTLPSNASEVWWPGVYTVGFQNPPLVEDWVLKITEVSDDGKQFKYEVTGSKTGPDGSGTSEEKFVSNSRCVVIDPKDFGLAAACSYTKKTCPPGFEIKWSVVPMCKDTYRAPKSKDPAKPVRTTVAQLIENGPHTLEILPNANGAVRIQAIQMFRPTGAP